MQGVLEVKRAGNELATRPGQKQTARKARRPIVSPAGQPPKPKRLTDEQAELAGEHWDWAMKIARKQASRFRQFPSFRSLDWESAAAEGLVDAAAMFRPELGREFEAYAAPRVFGAIMDMLRRERLLGYSRGCKESYQGAPKIQSLSSVISIDWISGKAHTLGHIIADESAPVGCELRGSENFEQAIRCLPRTNRKIFRLYYRDDRTMKEIAQELGCSESRVSQIHSASIELIRESTASIEALAS